MKKANEVLGDDPIVSAFNSRALLYRGIPQVNSVFTRFRGEQGGANKQPKPYPDNYSRADNECRKLMRRKDVATWARTESKRLGKEGNVARSATLIGQGGEVFGTVGGGLLLNLPDVIEVYQVNAGTGYGSKREYDDLPRGRPEMAEKIEMLQNDMETGNTNGPNEVMLDMRAWNCILYSAETEVGQQKLMGKRYLDAMFLRDAYQRESKSEHPLPIYEFSVKTGACTLKPVTDQLIIDAFVSIMREKISATHPINLPQTVMQLDTTDIRTWMKNEFERKDIVPLYQYFDQGLVQQITAALDHAKKDIVKSLMGQIVDQNVVSRIELQLQDKSSGDAVLKILDEALQTDNAKTKFTIISTLMKSGKAEDQGAIIKWIEKNNDKLRSMYDQNEYFYHMLSVICPESEPLVDQLFAKMYQFKILQFLNQSTSLPMAKFLECYNKPYVAMLTEDILKKPMVGEYYSQERSDRVLAILEKQRQEIFEDNTKKYFESQVDLGRLQQPKLLGFAYDRLKIAIHFKLENPTAKQMFSNILKHLNEQGVNKSLKIILERILKEGPEYYKKLLVDAINEYCRESTDNFQKFDGFVKSENVDLAAMNQGVSAQEASSSSTATYLVNEPAVEKKQQQQVVEAENVQSGVKKPSRDPTS